MSDEQQDLSFEDVGAGAEEVAGPRKPGIFSGLVLTILKWAAIVVGIVILVVTVTVITISFRDRGRTAQNLAATSPAYQGPSEPYAYYDSIENIRGQTSDAEPSSFLVQLSLGYTQNDKQVSVELGQRAREIQDLVLKHLAAKTADELAPRYYEVIQDELRSKINGVMISGKIQSVVFRQFAVTRM